MKGRIAALLIIAAILLPVAGLIVSDDAEAAYGTIDFSGTIEYKGVSMKNTEIRLDWDGSTEPFIGFGETDNNGKFTITYTGYYNPNAETSVIIRCTSKDVFRISAAIPIDIPIGSSVELGTITDSDFPTVYAPKAEITVLGTVKYGGTTVEGARVALFKDNGTKVEVDFINTNNNGVFEFKCVPGDYYIIVERNGFFNSEPLEFTIGDNVTKVLPEIYLIITPDTTYMGFDLPHLFTLIGLFMALILLLAVVIYVLWIRRHPGKIRRLPPSVSIATVNGPKFFVSNFHMASAIPKSFQYDTVLSPRPSAKDTAVPPTAAR